MDLANRPTKKIIKKVFLILAIILLAYGIWGLWQYHQLTTKNENLNPATVVTYSMKQPKEYKPDDSCKDYGSSEDVPLKITATDVGISGCIQKVGIDQNKSIAVPGNVHVSGWYVNSVKPGQKGVSIIDGHVSGRYSSGIFKNLSKLKNGDMVKVQFGDNSQKEFVVKSVDSYSVDDASKEQYKKLDGVDKQLTLITCGGKFDKKTQQYEKRVIVRAAYQP